MFGVSVGIMDGAGGAAGGSFESIQTITAAGGETSISFNSIPSTYKHLQLRGISRTNTGNNSPSIIGGQFNNDTTTANYVIHHLNGNGTTAAAGSGVPNGSVYAAYAVGSGALASTYGVTIMDVHDYASTTKNKTTRTLMGADTNTAANWRIYLASGLWLSTAAITSLQVNDANGMTAGSIYSLYGIKG